MINNYEIKKINNEEVLFIYFDINSEFANINKKEKYQDIKKHIKNYIKENRINFNGALAVIVIGSSIMGNILLNNDSKIDDATLFALKNEYQEIISNDFKKDNTIYTIDEKTTEEITSDIKKTSNDNAKENIILEGAIKKEDKQDNNTTNKKTEDIETSNENNNLTSSSENTNSNNTMQPPTEETKEEIQEVDNNTYITIQRSSGSVTLELEEYITGVVASEMPALFHTEALKAQAIIARTYALKAISKGQILSDTNSTQSYKDESQLRNIWGSNYNAYYNKIKNAVADTKGMYLTYNGTYIEAVYHSTSNGKTEDSTNAWGNYFPYLVSVSSEYDSQNPSFIVSTNFSYEKLSTLLGMEINSGTEFIIMDKTVSDRVKTISINDKIYTGVNFRNILGLRSTDFIIEKTDNDIIVTTKGYGHGVGMSQYGANGMAKNGYSYSQILSHYYPGTTLNHQ